MTATPHIDQATCRTRDPDLWFSDDAADKALAMHLCLDHCPLLNTCKAANIHRSHGVWAGVTYAGNGHPDIRWQNPSADNCDQCPAAPTSRRKPPSPWDDCGQMKAYDRHLKLGEYTCQPCRQANSDREARSRAERLRDNGLTREQRAAKRDQDRRDRDTQRQQTVDRIRQLAGHGVEDPDIGLRLNMPDYTVRRLRRLNGIPAGSKTTRVA